MYKMKTVMKKGLTVAVCMLMSVGLGYEYASCEGTAEGWDKCVRGKMEVMRGDLGEGRKGEQGGEDEGELVVMFWNLENFFDWVDEGINEGEKEFSSLGRRRWTRGRFYGKCDGIAKGIMWVGERYGRIPDVIGVAEVENRGVLIKLLNATALRKYDYGIVHYESGDRRGIDVALLYRRSLMEPVFSKVVTPSSEGEKMATRDILHVRMKLADGCEVDFMVNHHPSKYGGEESGARRGAAMRTLKDMCDSSDCRNVIAMGDFNDVPDSEPFSMIENLLVNKGMPLHEQGEGTIRYEGRWEMIDMFMVSESISEDARMEVCRIPFLMERDKSHPGEKPFRTYSGPRYIGGVSDHCPVVLKVNLL